MRLVWLVGALALVSPMIAHADTAPWAAGVSDEQKTQAKALLDAGNALLLEKKYVEALDKYTAAVAVWDHPAIRFNMVRCLIQLGRNLEAAENLDRSLKYGAAPLEETVYNEALAYQKLLATQIGDIAISCTQPGVILTLDGQPLATCPAQETRRVLAGPHQIVGNKAGLLPKTVELVVIGGKSSDASITLDPLEKGATIVHRWPTYVPWAVFGGGFAVAAAGGVLAVLGNNDMKTYDKFVDDRCTGNCTPEQLADVAHLKSGGELKGGLGLGLAITGGVAVATGAVMLYLNRGRTVYPEVAPAAGGGMTISLGGSF
ncbi:MAG: tetratricopeptide repeat protein [Kofleriaceae bacterium]|nr:tetratricopeptide repeat protein [Kofleriaceae bacterium]